MRLLIVTQKVDANDPILGFFHTWIVEFAKYAEAVTVICLEKGEYDLPPNVRVYSLGKETEKSRLKYVLNFYRYIWREKRSYDAVFVHMNPEYVVLGGWLWALLRKPVYLWYVHRQINSKLKTAAFFVRTIFTSSKESLRISTKKALYVGHGIDSEKLLMPSPDFSAPLGLLHLGRITRIKHIEVFIEALSLLRGDGIDAALLLAGECVAPEDNAYKRELLELIEEKEVGDHVHFTGALPASAAFARAQISVNGAPDGGMDKAVLESLAAKRPVFVANQAFQPVMSEYWDFFSYRHGDSAELTAKIKLFLALPQGQKEILVDKLEEKVRVEYDVRTLIKRIISTING